MRLIDQPTSKDFDCERLIEQLKQFSSQCIIQTMMLRGVHDGQRIDNTTEEEVEALIKAYKEIAPREIMLYSIDRSTPEDQLEKVSIEELREIAARIEKEGLKVQVN